MQSKNIVILGGGLAGLGAAMYLVKQGIRPTIIEQNSFLGGAAASVSIPGGRKVPAAYHQIVATDNELIKVLKNLALYKKISWKRTKISTLVNSKNYNLASPFDILMFPGMKLISKIRYMFFGIRCLLKKDWKDWHGKSVNDLLMSWANKEVLKNIFDPLVKIKFGFSSKKADAAWLGERLSHSEGNVPFGYIENASWTEELVNKIYVYLKSNGCKVMLRSEVSGINTRNGKAISVICNKKTIKVSALICALPAPVANSLLSASGVNTKKLAAIKYISSFSLLAGMDFVPFKEYWTIFLRPKRIFGGCFSLSLLNNSLITKTDKAVINLFTNLPYASFSLNKKEYISKAKADLETILKRKVKFNWVKVSKIMHTAPVYGRGYTNPEIQLTENIYLAGIYMTFPRFSSTGEAMASGVEAAKEFLSNKKT